VGVTRAQRSLTLCHTLTRSRFGRGEEALPSRFLFELKGETPPQSWSQAVRALSSGQAVPAARRRGKASRAGSVRRKPVEG
jgi:hypothetical protein